MKIKFLFCAVFSVVMLSSCVSTTFYQVYRVEPIDQLINKDNALIFEDDNCKVSYNLWGEGGNIGFKFYNKTDKNIYLNLGESFFILNGSSYNYYRNRVYTTTVNSGLTTTNGIISTKAVTGLNDLDFIQTNKISLNNTIGQTTSSGISVSIKEENILCIPPKTYKFISEYSVNSSLFRDCDLFQYPRNNQIITKKFTKEQSPIHFSNRISYSIGQNLELIKFENGFYVKEITNYPESEMIELKNDEFCGQVSYFLSEYFKNSSCDKFYIKYGVKQDKLEH